MTTGTKYGEASFSNKLWKVSAAPDLEDALEIEAIWDEGIGGEHIGKLFSGRASEASISLLT